MIVFFRNTNTNANTNTQIQLVMKCQKDPTYAIFLNSWWFNDVKNYITKCSIYKYRNANANTNTQSRWKSPCDFSFRFWFISKKDIGFSTKKKRVVLIRSYQIDFSAVTNNVCEKYVKHFTLSC